jgi:predicted lipid-binding transport protein (Tim44 family)
MRSGLPAGNPIANVLVIIAGALIVGASIVLGFFAFLALSAIVLISAAVIGVRVWWLNRKLASGQEQPHEGRPTASGVIEGEYRVVKKDHDET